MIFEKADFKNIAAIWCVVLILLSTSCSTPPHVDIAVSGADSPGYSAVGCWRLSGVNWHPPQLPPGGIVIGLEPDAAGFAPGRLRVTILRLPEVGPSIKTYEFSDWAPVAGRAAIRLILGDSQGNRLVAVLDLAGETMQGVGYRLYEEPWFTDRGEVIAHRVDCPPQ